MLEDTAILLARSGAHTRALELDTAAARLREEIGAPRPPASQTEADAALEPARAAIGSDEAARAAERGAALPLAEAVQLALA